MRILSFASAVGLAICVILGLCSASSVWCGPVLAQPTIEEVYLFPERYAGQIMIFDDAWMDGDVRRDREIFALDVKSTNGKHVIPGLFHLEGMAFIASQNIAETIVKHWAFKPNKWTGVRLTCRMEQMNDRHGYRAWACKVSSIGILSKGGDVMETVAARN